MRIALVIYGSINQMSGGYFYDRKLVAHLEQRGDQVDVLSLSSTSYGGALLQNPVASRLDYRSYDVVIQDELVHPSLFLANRLFLQARRRSGGPPVLALVHHLRVSESHPPFLMPLYRHVERSYLSHVDGYIFNTSATQKTVMDLCPGEKPSVTALPAGNFPRKKPVPADSLLAEDGPLSLLFVGNLIRRKGLHTVLQALIQMDAQGRNPVGTLYVAGSMNHDPAYVAQLRALAARLPAGLVQFLGPVPDVQLLELYSRCHILTVPSFHEGFGIVYLEAMGQGLVPVASSNGGASAVIDDGIDGFLVAPGSAERVQAILMELGSDRRRLARMRAAALEKAARFPDWEDSMETARNFIHNMASQGGG